jgi:WD40 repeat protein
MASHYLAFFHRNLVSGTQNRLRLWQVANLSLAGTSSLLNTWKLEDWIAGLAVSPDGRLLATVSDDGVIQIWGPPPS